MDIIDSMKVAETQNTVKVKVQQIEEPVKEEVLKSEQEEKPTDKINAGKKDKIRKSLNTPLLALGGVLILIILIASVLIIYHRHQVRWAKEVAIPEIEKLKNEADLIAAFNLLRKTEKYISNEARFKNLASFVTSRITILTDPPGADVYYREYSKVEGEWKKLGITPIDSTRMPNRTYFLVKIEKTGYEDLLAVMHTEKDTLSRKIFRKGTAPPMATQYDYG
jgi:hypothetical protein